MHENTSNGREESFSICIILDSIQIFFQTLTIFQQPFPFQYFPPNPSKISPRIPICIVKNLQQYGLPNPCPQLFSQWFASSSVISVSFFWSSRLNFCLASLLKNAQMLSSLCQHLKKDQSLVRMIMLDDDLHVDVSLLLAFQADTTMRPIPPPWSPHTDFLPSRCSHCSFGGGPHCDTVDPCKINSAPVTGSTSIRKIPPWFLGRNLPSVIHNFLTSNMCFFDSLSEVSKS